MHQHWCLLCNSQQHGRSEHDPSGWVDSHPTTFPINPFWVWCLCLLLNGQFRVISPLLGSIGEPSVSTEYHRRPTSPKTQKTLETHQWIWWTLIAKTHPKHLHVSNQNTLPTLWNYETMKLTFDTCHMLCRSSVCSAAASLAFKDASLGKNAGWNHMVDGVKIQTFPTDNCLNSSCQAFPDETNMTLTCQKIIGCHVFLGGTFSIAKQKISLIKSK